MKRNYDVAGPESKVAQEKGLVHAEWYVSRISRQRLKELLKRKDGPAIRDTILWIALLLGAGFVAYLAWGTWWELPAFALYGIIYTTTADSRWHESLHGTAFKTAWMNDCLFHLVSFMKVRPTSWRWGHVRHHRDTYIVGRDPEIFAPKPVVWRALFIEVFHLNGGPRSIQRIILHVFGKLHKVEKVYMPAAEYRKMIFASRVWVIIYSALIIWCIIIGSILPLMFVGLPTLYGPVLLLLFGMTQHLGLHEDVLDYRLNTRTIYMNHFFRFLFWNMNYHMEHHMYPGVPYHALPALHEELKADCPAPNPSIWSALKEVINTLVKQRKDTDYIIERPLPSTANPYYYGPKADK
jgi:fatty acid desaturase